MSKTVFYSKDAQFVLTDQEFSNFIKEADKGKKVWVPRLGAFLSGMFIWAGEKPEDNNRRVLHDGSVAVRGMGGAWVTENDPTVRIDLHYYPELAKDIDPDDVKQLNQPERLLR